MSIVCLILLIAALAYLAILVRKSTDLLVGRMDALASRLKSLEESGRTLDSRLAAWEHVRDNGCPVFSRAMLLDKQALIVRAQENLEREWNATGYAGAEESEVRKLKAKGMSRERAAEVALRQDKDLAEFENQTMLRTAMIKANLRAGRGEQTVEEALEDVRLLESKLLGDEEKRRRENHVQAALAAVYGSTP